MKFENKSTINNILTIKFLKKLIFQFSFAYVNFAPKIFLNICKINNNYINQ